MQQDKTSLVEERRMEWNLPPRRRHTEREGAMALRAVGRMEEGDWLQGSAEGKKCSLRCSAGANLRLQVGNPVTPA